MTAYDDRVLRDSLRGVLAGADDHDSVRASLAGQGWDEIAAAEGDPAWRVLFEELAVALSPAHALELLLEPVLAEDGAVTRLIYATERTAGQRALDARRGQPAYPRGAVRASQQHADRYVVLTIRPGAAAAVSAAAVSVVAAEDVSLEEAQGLDPDFRWQNAQLHADPVPCAGGPAIPAAIIRAQALHSWALCALSRRMLDIAIEHVTVRHQFGRPVGSFQAVKHMLADCAVELESLRAVLAYASDTLDPVAVIAARALAGRTSDTVSRAAQQCTGAMGFSSEFGLHRYLRRAHSYDLMLGPWPLHARNLGQLILDRSAVPVLGQA